MSSSIDAVCRELEAHGIKKWEQLYSVAEKSGEEILKQQIKQRTPVQTGKLQENVEVQLRKTGKFSASMIAYEGLEYYPGGQDTVKIAGYQEKGTARNKARYMFRDGSEAAWPLFVKLLESNW